MNTVTKRRKDFGTVKHVERDARICAMRATGLTMLAIARVFGITEARVQQILTRERERAQDQRFAERAPS